MNASMPWPLLPLLSAALLLIGCGGDDRDGAPTPCTAGTPVGCDSGQVCEPVAGEEAPACFAPVELSGRVFDSTSGTGLVGATVVALDVNGSAASAVVLTAEEGRYRLRVAVERSAGGGAGAPARGAPLTEFVTLRVAAAGYLPFPKAPRTALPIDLGAATAEDGAWVPSAAAADVALIPLRTDASELGTIRGRVDHPDAAGVLAIAVQGGAAIASAVADGASLQPGMLYQFRAVSYRDPHRGGERETISATEDLRGTFLFDPAPTSPGR